MDFGTHKFSPDEVGRRYAELLKPYFGCDVQYVGDVDIYHNDDFYQLEFLTDEKFDNIELIEEKVSEAVSDVINLAKFGPQKFQATIWLASESK